MGNETPVVGYCPTCTKARGVEDARVAELEQRLRVVADPDGEEREALRARVKELERILSVERAEYDWAVQGAKALEAKVEAVRGIHPFDASGRIKTFHEVMDDLLAILNGGTDGTR